MLRGRDHKTRSGHFYRSEAFSKTCMGASAAGQGYDTQDHGGADRRQGCDAFVTAVLNCVARTGYIFW